MSEVDKQYRQGQEDYGAGKISVYEQLEIESTILFNYWPEKWAYASGWRTLAVADGWVFSNNSVIGRR